MKVPTLFSLLTMSQGCTVDLISLIGLAASKATIILKHARAAAARSRPLSAVCRWDHRSPPTLCSVGRGFSRCPAEGLSLCRDWQTWIKYHPTGLSDWWMTIDYKNVLGKWRFMIGGRDQKGRVFPANPELDNSRDLDSGFCFFRLDRPCSGPAENNPRKA